MLKCERHLTCFNGVDPIHEQQKSLSDVKNCLFLQSKYHDDRQTLDDFVCEKFPIRCVNS